MALDAATRDVLLALADDEHMIGARHTAWIGLGPFLEEDLAFCSIAQDELGHAIGLYEILLRDAGRDPLADLDSFALLRDPADYRSCHLAEIECGDWADSLVRHWLYDRAERFRWEELTDAAHTGVAALAVRALAEERFHLDHAERFMSRVARTEQVAAAIERLLPLAVGAFAGSSWFDRWADELRGDARRWGITLGWPDDQPVVAHRDRAVRSAGFGAFHQGLTRVLRLDPSATW